MSNIENTGEQEEISADELFEQHKAEIEQRFEERGFFRRIGDMVTGLSKPSSSPEYKIARTELQRLAAPLVAILLPVMGVIILIVVTAVSGQRKEIITVDIGEIQEDSQDLTEEVDEEPQEIDMTQDVDVSVEISADMPTPTMTNPAPPSPSPGGEPNKVEAAPSPVTMSAVSGTVKMRGMGDGDGGGFGSIIGGGKGGQNTEGCLIGVIVDFKRDGSGKDIPCDQNKYKANIGELARANFSPAALSKFYVLPKKVALTHIFIDEQPAANGPKAFGCEALMKPMWWVAYYTGTIASPEKARYRFVGYADEAMICKIGGKVVFETYWGIGPQKKNNGKGPFKGPFTGWSGGDPELVGKWQSPQGNSALVVGDWFTMTQGRAEQINIAIGEGPGGNCGFALFIQKEGVEYPMVDGHPKLPLFASRPLSFKDKQRIEGNRYKVSTDSPKFNSRGAKKAMEKVQKDDVSVEVDI